MKFGSHSKKLINLMVKSWTIGQCPSLKKCFIFGIFAGLEERYIVSIKQTDGTMK